MQIRAGCSKPGFSIRPYVLIPGYQDGIVADTCLRLPACSYHRLLGEGSTFAQRLVVHWQELAMLRR